MKHVIDIGDLADATAAPALFGSKPTFEFDPERAAAALAKFAVAPEGLNAIAGDDWAQGAMGALLQAELLAADAGVVPYFTLPSGDKGILTIGAARQHIDSAPEDVRTIYLAIHGLVRQTHASARPAADGVAPPLGCTCDHAPELGAFPLWVVVVLGVAAVVATAGYFIHRDTIELEGQNLRATAAATAIGALARQQLATTGKIDPEAWSSLRGMAGAEESHWSTAAIVGAAAAVGLVGAAALAWHHFRGKDGRGHGEA